VGESQEELLVEDRSEGTSGILSLRLAKVCSDRAY